MAKEIEGYTEEELDDWAGYLDTILQAITDGVYDEDLALIAKACYDRRDILRSEAEPVMPAAALAVPPARGVATATSAAPACIYGTQGVFIKATRARASALTWTHPVTGKRYARRNLLNAVLRLNSSARWYLADLLVQIVSVGTTTVTVKLLESAIAKYPKATEPQKKNMVTGHLMTVDIEVIDHIFA